MTADWDIDLMSRLISKTVRRGEDTLVKPYLCYIHRPTRSIADLTLIVCQDGELERKVDALATEWTGFTRIEVYDGERRVLARLGDGRVAAA